tara:strand:- start:316 stop:564 length:249 start_codon:yes stop_codon:yes gene_type:complete
MGKWMGRLGVDLKISITINALFDMDGGGGGIRTPGAREGSTVFKTAAFNHSATPPAGCVYIMNAGLQVPMCEPNIRGNLKKC